MLTLTRGSSTRNAEAEAKGENQWNSRGSCTSRPSMERVRMPSQPNGQLLFHERLRRRKSGPTEYLPTTTEAVFWACRIIINPAFDSRELLKAGDIEANPGPARKKPSISDNGSNNCETCNKAMMRPGLSCMIASCQNVSHKQKICSCVYKGTAKPKALQHSQAGHKQ